MAFSSTESHRPSALFRYIQEPGIIRIIAIIKTINIFILGMPDVEVLRPYEVARLLGSCGDWISEYRTPLASDEDLLLTALPLNKDLTCLSYACEAEPSMLRNESRS